MPETQASYLGFDFGLKRIGIAVGQAVTGSATPLVVLGNTPELINSIKALIEEWRPTALVVGLPLDTSGNETEMSQAARQFAGRLHGITGLKVYLQDERFSSVDASREFAELRRAGVARRSQARRQDALAARLFLETWLRQHDNGSAKDLEAEFDGSSD